MSRHQTPDDHICSPARFIERKADGSPQRTYEIRSEWTREGTRRLGELVEWDSREGVLIFITMEEVEGE